MPTVEKVSGGRVNVRKANREFVPGERYDVGEGVAAYLVEERGDFEYADDEDGDAEDDDDVDVCGAELSGGGTCDRPADECQYHGDDAED